MTDTSVRWLRSLVAIGLAIEVLCQANWLARIVPLLAIYDVVVWAMVGARAIVTALQAAAALAIWQRAPAGPVLGQWALAVSAGLIVFEVGLGLTPSSLPPGLRWPWVLAYVLYAALAVLMLRRTRERRS
jgi:hypothetical protein